MDRQAADTGRRTDTQANIHEHGTHTQSVGYREKARACGPPLERIVHNNLHRWSNISSSKERGQNHLNVQVPSTGPVPEQNTEQFRLHDHRELQQQHSSKTIIPSRIQANKKVREQQTLIYQAEQTELTKLVLNLTSG